MKHLNESLANTVLDRICLLSHTLRNKTTRLINLANAEITDNLSDDKIPPDGENGFIASINRDYNEMIKLKSELMEKCNTYRIDVSLELLISLVVMLHISNEKRIKNLYKLPENDDPEELKSNFTPEVPVEAFREIVLKSNVGDNNDFN